jgi:hypothetical protein
MYPTWSAYFMNSDEGSSSIELTGAGLQNTTRSESMVGI